MNARPPTEKVLIFAAEPRDQARLQLGKELRTIRDRWERSKLRGRWAVKTSLATRAGDLAAQMRADSLLVVHFSGHGAGAGGLVLEDDDGQHRLVDTAPLADLFRMFRDRIACVVLNACYSEAQAAVIADHIPYVIGMKQEIGDRAAISFSLGFYDALFDSEPIDRAFEFGCNRIQLDGAAGPDARTLSTGAAPAALPEHQKPVLLGRRGPIERLPRRTKPADVVAPSVGRDLVIRFGERFKSRKPLWDYLRANKGLHDILHALRNYFPRIKKAVAALLRSGDRPRAESVADKLTGWVLAARACVQKTEFPDRAPPWFAQFEAVLTLTASELGGTVALAEQEGAVEALVLAGEAGRPGPKRLAEILKNVPVRAQELVNDKLLEYALRLDMAELTDLTDELLTRPLGGAAARLGEPIRKFREQCQVLRELVGDHDRCQKVDMALRAVVGVGGVGPTVPSQWGRIGEWVEEIAAARPGHLYAGRVLDAARRFAAADPKQAAELLDLFRERFDQMFLEMDRELLEVTRDLVQVVEVLDAHLEGYLS